MPIILASDVENAVCSDCGKPVPPDGPFCGPGMWCHRHWICGHPKTWTCWECVGRREGKGCPVCGCGWEYT